MATPTASRPVQALVVTTYVLMIAMNGLANALPINGRTTGGVSDAYGNLFAPAGLTFSIWGVIYLLLGAHVLYQLGLFRSGEAQADRSELLGRVGVLFSLSSLANVSWILAWHYDLMLLSTVLLATMLVLLIAITRTIRGAGPLTTRESLLVRLPFSVYFGWITVATIANVTVWLVSVGWDGFGITEPVWAVAIIGVGAIIGTTVIVRDRDVAYGLVLVWAYLGIWIKHVSEGGFDGAYPAVSTAALVCLAIFVVAGALTLRRPAPARAVSRS